MTIDPFLTLAAFGIGIVVGLTGMGGGALMTPVLVLFFSVPPLTAVSSDLVASAVMKPVGSFVHLRRGTVHLGLVKWLCLGSIPARSAACSSRARSGGGRTSRTWSGWRWAWRCSWPRPGSIVRAYIRLVEHARRRDGRAAPLSQERPDVVLRPLPTIVLGALGGIVVGLTSVGSGSLIIIALMALYPTLKASQLVGHRPGAGRTPGRLGGPGAHPVRRFPAGAHHRRCCSAAFPASGWVRICRRGRRAGWCGGRWHSCCWPRRSSCSVCPTPRPGSPSSPRCWWRRSLWMLVRRHYGYPPLARGRWREQAPPKS